jgi:hypothetical protein
MSSVASVEERVERLEKDLAEVRQRLNLGPGSVNWIPSVVGSISKYADFKEVVRLGREIRRADRSDLAE